MRNVSRSYHVSLFSATKPHKTEAFTINSKCLVFSSLYIYLLYSAQRSHGKLKTSALRLSRHSALCQMWLIQTTITTRNKKVEEDTHIRRKGVFCGGVWVRIHSRRNAMMSSDGAKLSAHIELCLVSRFSACPIGWCRSMYSIVLRKMSKRNSKERLRARRRSAA